MIVQARRAGLTPQVRHTRRVTGLMVAASFSTGLVDGGTYLALEHVFIANQTGNLIFLGLGATGNAGFAIARSAIALAGFAIGAATAGFVQRRASAGRGAGPTLMAVGIGLGVLSVALAVGPEGARWLDVLAAAFAFVMGAQAAAARVVAVADVPTVVVTSTLASLASEPWFGAQRAERTGRRAAAIGAMLAGAVLGALLARAEASLSIALAAVVLATVGWFVADLARSSRSE